MSPVKTKRTTKEQVTLEFPDNRLLAGLSGSHQRNFVRLEQKLDVRIATRGNLVAVEGTPEMVSRLPRPSVHRSVRRPSEPQRHA